MAYWQKALDKGRAIARDLASILKDVVREAARDKINLLGAALAYFSLFSLGPLLFLVIQIAGLVYGVQLAEREALTQVQGFIGPGATEALSALLQAAHRPQGGLFSAVIGIATLIAGASGMVLLIQDALNTIWGVPPAKAGRPLARALRALEKYLFAMGGILVVGLLLLASIIVGTLMETFQIPLEIALPGGVGLWLSLNEALSFGSITVAFALLFRYVPDAIVSWRHAWQGAFASTLLFGLGKYALSLYLARSNLGNLYGAAGSLLVLLVWIYYSAVILFVGAEITKVQGKRQGPS
ncbi:YihY/virulence factor BrkB family protein [bacterium]|nr:YihY/virulence factor BrkB family protein [bacterium]